jgi:hypothetical protein
LTEATPLHVAAGTPEIFPAQIADFFGKNFLKGRKTATRQKPFRCSRLGDA